MISVEVARSTAGEDLEGVEGLESLDGSQDHAMARKGVSYGKVTCQNNCQGGGTVDRRRFSRLPGRDCSPAMKISATKGVHCQTSSPMSADPRRDGVAEPLDVGWQPEPTHVVVTHP